jgi:hypothetical protein
VASQGRDATVTAQRATRGRFGELVNSTVLLGSKTTRDATEASGLDRLRVIEVAAESQLAGAAYEIARSTPA